MEAANARLAAFSRRARIALSAAAAAVTTALAAMTRATIQVATQTQQFAQVAKHRAGGVPAVGGRLAHRGHRAGEARRHPEGRERSRRRFPEHGRRPDGRFLRAGRATRRRHCRSVRPPVGTRGAATLRGHAGARRPQPAGDDLLSRGHGVGRHPAAAASQKWRGRNGTARQPGRRPRRGAGRQRHSGAAAHPDCTGRGLPGVRGHPQPDRRGAGPGGGVACQRLRQPCVRRRCARACAGRSDRQTSGGWPLMPRPSSA